MAYKMEPQKSTTKFDAKLAVGCVLLIGMFLLFCALLYGMIFGVASPTHSTAQTTTRPVSIVWRVAHDGWCVLLIGLLLQPLVKGEAQKHFRLFRLIRPLMVAQNLLVIAAVIACALGLLALFPFLDRSWLYMFPITGGRVMNIAVLPAFVKYVGLAFVVLLALNLPMLAYGEEKSYRQGTKNWKQGARRSLRFGLMHCFVGVPLFGGLALSVGGLWFTHQYFRGGIERSAAHHLTYNLIVVVLLFLYLLHKHGAF